MATIGNDYVLQMEKLMKMLRRKRVTRLAVAQTTLSDTLNSAKTKARDSLVRNCLDICSRGRIYLLEEKGSKTSEGEEQRKEREAADGNDAKERKGDA